ncbi:MAG: imidazole glycerol phosphate synthase subunit HisH, partial [Gammaproteobacteria bacterium]
MSSIVVIDYGMGNLRSVAKALEKVAVGQNVLVTQDAEHIYQANRVVFPGVGAMKDCISELQRLELDEVIKKVVNEKPLLGICLGMQGLLDSTEENGGSPGLGIIPGRVIRFDDPLIEKVSGEKLKVPHMGWNHVEQVIEHPLWNGIEDQTRFYFVHSYYAVPEDSDHILGQCEYGTRITVAVGKQNLFAVQFHPEKSQHAGL